MGPVTKVIALTCAMLCALPVAVRAGGENGTIEILEGGSLSSGFRLSLGFLYGAGSRPDGLGAPVSTVRGGAASISGNPAGLAYITSNAVVMDILPPFGATASDFVDLDSVAADALDEAVDDFAAPGFDPTYPSLSTDVGQPGGVISGAIGFRTGRVVLGAAIEEPVAVALELVDTGIEAFGHTFKDEGDDLIDIQVRCMADAAADFAFDVSKTTIAAATQVRPDVAVGLSVSHVTARASLSGNVRGDGVVSYGGQEYAFNDPEDPWENELGMTTSGAFDGGGFGWNVEAG
jgi:enamine deaminase RidA (YjgF/YER057c/UK114 family)